MKTVRQLTDTFERFSRVSGLVANCGKSNVYMAGVDTSLKNYIVFEL